MAMVRGIDVSIGLTRRCQAPGSPTLPGLKVFSAEDDPSLLAQSISADLMTFACLVDGKKWGS
jgi:hypothetical protein